MGIKNNSCTQRPLICLSLLISEQVLRTIRKLTKFISYTGISQNPWKFCSKTNVFYWVYDWEIGNSQTTYLESVLCFNEYRTQSLFTVYGLRFTTKNHWFAAASLLSALATCLSIMAVPGSGCIIKNNKNWKRNFLKEQEPRETSFFGCSRSQSFRSAPVTNFM